jgi:manganese/zinc/iron transport system permease protein
VFGLPYTDTVVVLGALVLGVTSGVLGTFAVLRQRSLVGDAVAHSTLPGVCVAFLVAGVKDVPGLLVGAAVAGMVAALLMVGIERTRRIKPDTAIGVVLSGFFSLGIVLLTYIGSRQDSDQAGLGNYLFGQAAGLLETDVVVMAALGGTALLVVAALRRALTTTLFDAPYAGSIGLPVRALEILMTGLLVVAVVIGVRVVGAILMVAMLVVPTVVARQLADRFPVVLLLAGATGAVVGVTGALAATRAALPTGPVIVLVGFTLAVLAVLLAPGRGIVWRGAELAARRRRVLRDAVLVEPAAPPRTVGDRWARASLRRQGLLAADGLTPAGEVAAADLADRRALWSAWLAHGASVRLPDAREPDPTDLRGSLGDDAVEQLRRLSTGAVTAGTTSAAPVLTLSGRRRNADRKDRRVR